MVKYIVITIMLVCLVVVVTYKYSLTIKNYNYKRVVINDNGNEVQVKMIGHDKRSNMVTTIASPYSMVIAIKPSIKSQFKAVIKEVRVTNKQTNTAEYKNTDNVVEAGEVFSDGTINAVFTYKNISLDYADYKTCIRYSIVGSNQVPESNICVDLIRDYSEKKSNLIWEIISGV